MRGDGVDLKFGRMKNLVGGEFVESVRGEWERIIDPATGEVIAEVPRCAEEDVDRAVEAASRAFEWWFETTPAGRSEMLHALAGALEEHAEDPVVSAA
jgi:acyl-CoA reductase-like NAD-dependent aldehyde dehydrogenase